jgi:hypothetical protein
MAWKALQYRLKGDAPLVMHSGELANPLSKYAKLLKQVTSKKAKTDADHEKMAEIEYVAGLYMTEKDGPVIPGQNLESAIYEGAKKTKEGKVAKSALFAPGFFRLDYDGPRTAEELFALEQFRLTASVKVNMSRVMRTRPLFPEWSSIVTLQYEDAIVNIGQVDRWVQTAGTQIGLGDWRPRYGRFSVERLNN